MVEDKIIDKTKRIVCVAIDDMTKEQIDKFGSKHGLSRSATIRYLINEYFLTRGKDEGK